jgi:hypothetical protein
MRAKRVAKKCSARTACNNRLAWRYDHTTVKDLGASPLDPLPADAMVLQDLGLEGEAVVRPRRQWMGPSGVQFISLGVPRSIAAIAEGKA